jgi:predicted O-methyltransferase YrrM
MSSAGENEQGLLHTIEINPELEEMIRRFIREAGFEDRIVLHMGDAMDIIPVLNEQWDLVYIDSDKPNYLNYYNMVFDRVRLGGIILADNALWSGKVLDPHTSDEETLGIIAFNDFVQKDNRVENVLLPIRDGIMMIMKK